MRRGRCTLVIGPAPYRDKRQAPCEECEFASLCSFDRVAGVYRDVPRMGREEALEAMRRAMEDFEPRRHEDTKGEGEDGA